MFTAAWDEPFALPTEETTTMALRTQQVLAYETGVARTVDPLGGSYFVEELTDAMEDRIISIMKELEDTGGVVDAIETGRLQQSIGDTAAQRQARMEAGEDIVVGVNKYASDSSFPDIEGYELDAAGVQGQLDRLAEVRRTRDASAAEETLRALEQAAATDAVNLMPLLVDCAKAYCTIGEISGVLREIWGEFQQPKVI